MGGQWRKENPNPRVHHSGGKLGEPHFPLERVDPRVGIFLSPLTTHDGFYLSLISWSLPDDEGGITCMVPDHLFHYENVPMQYTENFFESKTLKFHWKKFDIFNIFAQNIDCGYMLSTHNLCLDQK